MTIWQRQMIALFTAHLTELDNPTMQKFDDVVERIATKIGLFDRSLSFDDLVDHYQKLGSATVSKSKDGYNLLMWKGDQAEMDDMVEMLKIRKG